MSPGAGRTGREAGQLSELARRHGVQLSYIAADGSPRWSGPDAVVAALAGLGVPISRPAEAAEVLAAERRAPALALEPVIAQWSGRSEPVTVGLPSRSDPRSAWLTLCLEDGQELRQRVGSDAPAPVRLAPEVGGEVDYYQVRMAAGLGTLPPGYHRLRLEADGVEASSLMVVAPRCPAPRRSWGASIPLYALRAADDWGIGNYVGLARLAAWLGERGAAWVGMLPIFPTFLDTPAVDPSPYLPVTRLAWNEIHVDPTRLPELVSTPSAVRRLESPEFESRLRKARQASRVDHAAVMSTLRSILEPMARTLFAAPSSRRNEFDAFLIEHPHLEAYARFRTGVAGVKPEDPGFSESLEYHLYAQWAAETQLAAAAGRPEAGLYLDLPVGVHPSGFDPVWEPKAFVAGIHGGAPPDIFQPAGQDWAFPPLNPEGLRSQEYRYLIDSLRHAMRHADAVRIDHVMSLHRLYWIPEGADATDGVYVNYPDAEMRAVVSLEASRSGTVVVGEDLGTVPAPVRTDMRHDGMLRSWVLQFESTAKDPLPSPPRQALATWGTHDLATFAGYWDGLDIDEREDRGGIDRREAAAERRQRREWRRALDQRLSVPVDDPRAGLHGCLDHLASSPAAMVLVDLEDLWLERVPHNRPGTGVGHGNWERRSALSLEEMFADPQVQALLASVDLRRSAPEPSRRGDGRRTMRRAG